ncbi:hypothetical protein [Phenylobacterium sp.]|uniref:hypothetical protein n=1 Tax=Phenylobacterium sp. TaxID=1871053 RepID=UPI00301DC154
MTSPAGLEAASVALGALAALASIVRLTQLKAQNRIPPHLADYFAPITETARLRAKLGGRLTPRGGNVTRMRNGRVLALVLGRSHREIGDRWLTGFVHLQRFALVAAIGFFLADQFGA